ncbi:MAG: hypothetical protein RIB43_00615 [Rhodospirillaceae bacterium]
MTSASPFMRILLASCLALSVAACSDSSTEIASPGNSGPNPGVGGGGTGGGGGGGGTPPPSAGTCPTGTTEITVGSSTHCELSGVITSNVTLQSGNLYSLKGKVVVGENTDSDGSGGTAATLTIQPGTTVYGQNLQSYLVVSRGSRIEAAGTQSSPIIFTSAQDLSVAAEFGQTQRAIYTGEAANDPNTSEWGGIVINGLATLNTCNQVGVCEEEGEGDSGLYGGNNNADDSGTLRYVVVKYAGNPITSTDELNGIAFQGVGSGTTIDYLQVHNGADDGVEFFGGTVNARHVVITGADDDSLDWTFGWRGKVQYLLVIQNPNQPNSDRAIEADNLEGNNDFLPRSAPLISNATLIGGSPSVGDTGIVLRRGTAARIWNVVATGWRDACYDLDDTATFTVAGTNATSLSGDTTIQSSLFDCDDPTDDEAGDPFSLEQFVLSQLNNVFGNSSLSGFVNGTAEAAVTATDVSAVDSFFDSVDYIGAISTSTAPGNWTLGWSFGLNPAASCPAGTTASGSTQCILEGVYTSDIRLVAGFDYILRGRVDVGIDAGQDPAAPLATGNTAVMTIDPGVRVLGENVQSYLVVTRGSQLRSNGTATAPVVFSAISDDTANLDTDTSLWGGLVINGRARLNTCNQVGVCEEEGEGDSGLYGGVDDTDNSGNLFYTVVKYAGNPITATDELNGIAFQGVGSGTSIDYLQVHNGADDGVEFFGGTVNAKHLVITGADDDSIDWTFGWRGKIQYAVVYQNDNQPNSDRAIEADNLEGNNDFLPRSAGLISNVTFVGGTSVGDTGIVLRRGTTGRIWNAVVTNWRDACYDLDDTATFTATGTSATSLTGATTVQSSLFNCTDPTDDEAGDPFDLAAFVNGQANNDLTTTNTLTAANGSTGNRRFINGTAENALTATDVSLVDSFFDSVGFVGAVQSGGSNWTSGWTVWLND